MKAAQGDSAGSIGGDREPARILTLAEQLYRIRKLDSPSRAECPAAENPQVEEQTEAVVEVTIAVARDPNNPGWQATATDSQGEMLGNCYSAKSASQAATKVWEEVAATIREQLR